MVLRKLDIYTQETESRFHPAQKQIQNASKTLMSGLKVRKYYRKI
jgi:hypothetical protein